MLNTRSVFENCQFSSNFDSLQGAYVQYDYTFMDLVSTHFEPKTYFGFCQFLSNSFCKTQIPRNLGIGFTLVAVLLAVYQEYLQAQPLRFSWKLATLSISSWATPAKIEKSTLKNFFGGAIAPPNPPSTEAVRCPFSSTISSSRLLFYDRRLWANDEARTTVSHKPVVRRSSSRPTNEQPGPAATEAGPRGVDNRRCPFGATSASRTSSSPPLLSTNFCREAKKLS